MMDAFNEPDVEEIVIMKSSQTGGTEVINNAIGYYIEHDPCPILVVQPTGKMAATWSKDRFAPMIRDTEVLRNLVSEVKSRDSENTIEQKKFPGGLIAIIGSNSPANLASRPIRNLFLDEIDRFPESAGTEGDPSELAVKRTKTFFNRKVCRVSTPTIKGLSAIEKAWELSDQRHFLVPCPYCGGKQRLIWGQVKWDKTEGEHLPDTAYYECEFCQAQLQEFDKFQMIRNGEWVKQKPHVVKVAGFHISELYSPWSTWAEMAKNFLDSRTDRDKLQVFINTGLGETWEDEGLSVSDEHLMSRRERYGPTLPLGVCLLTAGVDIQDDRVECIVKGWGRGEESWKIDYRIFPGNISKTQKPLEDLELFLTKNFRHELNEKIVLKISAVCIDSGHHTKQVYDFCRGKHARRVFPIKGQDGEGKPVIGRPWKSRKYKTIVYPVGTDTCKELIYSRLTIEEFGPGYMHFDKACDEEYFKQLTAEKRVVLKSGKRAWKQIRARNEALDCEVYAMAALHTINVEIDLLAQHFEDRARGHSTSPGRKRSRRTHSRGVM